MLGKLIKDKHRIWDPLCLFVNCAKRVNFPVRGVKIRRIRIGHLAQSVTSWQCKNELVTDNFVQSLFPFSSTFIFTCIFFFFMVSQNVFESMTKIWFWLHVEDNTFEISENKIKSLECKQWNYEGWALDIFFPSVGTCTVSAVQCLMYMHALVKRAFASVTYDFSIVAMAT